MAAAFLMSDSDMEGLRPPLRPLALAALKPCDCPLTNQAVLELASAPKI